MLGDLHPDEIEDILFRHHVGQIACVADGLPYIVPITYVYDAGCIYGHTVAGRKVDAMRAQPAVGFGVQEHTEPGLWRSVVTEGTYEEIEGDVSRVTVLAMLANVTPHVRAGDDGVVFRVLLGNRSGRWLRTEHPD